MNRLDSCARFIQREAVEFARVRRPIDAQIIKTVLFFAGVYFLAKGINEPFSQSITKIAFGGILIGLSYAVCKVYQSQLMIPSVGPLPLSPYGCPAPCAPVRYPGDRLSPDLIFSRRVPEVQPKGSGSLHVCHPVYCKISCAEANV